MTTDEPQENPFLSAMQMMSGFGASLDALKRAGITGIGIIRRKEDGYYESVDPDEFIAQIEAETKKGVALEDIDHYELHVDTAETRIVPYMSNRDEANAHVVVAVLKDGSRKLIKNRFGPLDDERYLKETK